ncbi:MULTISPECIES: hypothetical protein [Vibrio]|uniref:hypothetical protein n=1 Tax=Vibrio TaxID=662 RepID=UPI001BD46372|nr:MULTISPECIES: hypothetical protein [Vibrio]MBS9931082.1 hypothetical protein [Vibrio alginolyticus]MCG9744749.1 hypothetical protein [Vibrio alginolyticus]MDW1637167.1 hypothetical protein [Vibrio sp. Vb2907]MDW1707948.1 hypothetical protein [Vibrio sp. Vb2917]MDW1722489.1 hypothetical protein [Vibrio sp. Vb2979]
MEIASGFTAKDWHELQLDHAKKANWDVAIDVLKRRIMERYIEPVDILLELENDKGYQERRFGFSVVSIDCMLIETLQAFIDGRKETKPRFGKQAFINYMSKGDVLGQYFSEELAGRFYKEYRNGLLHQAETKNKALIWSKFEVVALYDDQMVINRTELHRLIRLQFESYLESLSDTSQKKLRQNFIKKMNFIARV